LLCRIWRPGLTSLLLFARAGTLLLRWTLRSLSATCITFLVLYYPKNEFIIEYLILCSSLELIKRLVDAQLLHELVDEHSLLDISALSIILLSFVLVVPRLPATGFTGFLVWLLMTQLAILFIFK